MHSDPPSFSLPRVLTPCWLRVSQSVHSFSPCLSFVSKFHRHFKHYWCITCRVTACHAFPGERRKRDRCHHLANHDHRLLWHRKKYGAPVGYGAAITSNLVPFEGTRRTNSSRKGGDIPPLCLGVVAAEQQVCAMLVA